jgi:hypothetical protein
MIGALRPVAARTVQRSAVQVLRRGYAEVADDKLKLSLVLPHQVGVIAR